MRPFQVEIVVAIGAGIICCVIIGVAAYWSGYMAGLRWANDTITKSIEVARKL